ncbi:PDZ domain-containing protein [Pendulispora brunnea]|uniref:PDZ domain-containing protein n=1 Tax=Pendulispora brunnea TaxID=2905690 RepID=A0ABZ2KPP7_9BACT
MQGASVGIGLFVLVSCVLFNTVAFVVLRYAMGLAVGVKGLQVACGVEQRPWAGVGLGRKLLFVLAGPLGCYLCATILLIAGSLLGGKETIDDTSMRVVVVPGGPASDAGLRDGDRIITVAGEPVADWDALRAKVARHAGVAVRLEVERQGQRLVLSPTPDANGKISVGTPVEHRSMGLGEAIGAAIAEPPAIWANTLRGMVRILVGSAPSAVSGPIAIAQAAGRATLAGNTLRFIGALNVYYLWIPILVALVLFPGIGVRRTRPAP